tara:strand:+ start:460 stop:561 length:102 start_codon:yes stop_codon:yes gene_type:complete
MKKIMQLTLDEFLNLDFSRVEKISREVVPNDSN